MIKKTYKYIIIFILVLIFFTLTSNFKASAETTENNTKYFLGDVVNTGKNTGYSEKNKITEDDPHYGWTIGDFFISDYTRVIDSDSKNPIFLKTLGDTVTLGFNLNHNIKNINKENRLSVAEDKKGYDSYFGIKKTNFGHGTLIIRHTDYQNKTQEPTLYTDYLSSIEVDANTKVEFLEEGDYEVAFNYSIKDDPREVLGVSILPNYEDYKIAFKFSVRNGNCMVFPFDSTTEEELTNTSITENGFYLDLAKSRYLDIDIKKEVLKDGANGLREDTRFNRPAKDGDKYTEEGIYTIKVTNRYTEQETIKKIYVGTNNILKAHVTTGQSIDNIKTQIEDGATIKEDGTLLLAAKEPSIPTKDENETKIDTTSHSNKWTLPSIIVIFLLVLIFLTIIISKFRKLRASKDADSNENIISENNDEEV